MYKTIALLLVALFVAASLPALAEGSVPEALYSQEITEVSASPDGAQDNAAPEGAASSGSLPLGTWVNGEDGVSFSFETETPLTEEQRALVASGAFAQEVPDPVPAGMLLPMDVVTALWPELSFFSDPVAPQPELTMFELTGEWFYNEEGTLCYQHDEGFAPMTIDEVYDALSGPEGGTGEGKTIYLTIDDAPSVYTIDLLSVLRSLDVKATFFVVGAYVRNRPEFTRAIYDEGHLLANHSYTHDKEVLSASFSSCLNDFQRTENIVSETLGFPLSMPILRVPYGASTIPVGFRTQLQELGYLWIDWNALNGDTESGVKSDEDALERAYSTAERYADGDIVMLVHDGKKRTIRTLPEMVAYFRDKGYTFDVLHVDMEKIPGVRMGLPLTEE